MSEGSDRNPRALLQAWFWLYHWKKMTGREAPLKVAKHPYTVSKKSFYRESFRLRSEKNKVFISGEQVV